MAKSLKFGTSSPKTPKPPKFDTSFDFGLNKSAKKTGSKKKSSGAAGGS